jgi:hypothetical protein
MDLECRISAMSSGPISWGRCRGWLISSKHLRPPHGDIASRALVWNDRKPAAARQASALELHHALMQLAATRQRTSQDRVLLADSYSPLPQRSGHVRSGFPTEDDRTQRGIHGRSAGGCAVFPARLQIAGQPMYWKKCFSRRCMSSDMSSIFSTRPVRSIS